MTTTDMLNRLNDALRNSDQEDLTDLAQQIDRHVRDPFQRDAWLALIETASETLYQATH